MSDQLSLFEGAEAVPPTKRTAKAGLVPIFETGYGKQQTQTVNARDLHAFLESKQDFSTWIKSRIEQYGFVEGEDFAVEVFFHKIMEKHSRGRPQIDYHITLDMAKELSMVERNAKGKAARKYFIQCEKIARSRSAKWHAVRDEGKEARSSYTQCLVAHGCDKPQHHINCTRGLTTIVVGASPAEIRKTRCVASARDGMTRSELAAVKLAESLAEDRIEAYDAQGFKACFGHTKVAATSVAGALIQCAETAPELVVA